MFAASLIAAGSALGDAIVVNGAVTESEVLAAQKSWCEALVGISATVFFCGMPTIAIGPVDDEMTPTLTCAPAAQGSRIACGSSRTSGRRVQGGCSLSVLTAEVCAMRSWRA